VDFLYYFCHTMRKLLFVPFAVCLLMPILLRAQVYDTDALKEVPEKESLPVRSPALSIEPVKIPLRNLDLKVDYWRNWTTFGINANQASFSDNWNGGGVNSISVGVLFN